ncbi:MAG: DUF1405 domain-containing protein [Chloroflexi bacterium]|nr:DUF1405 domain-containing protein [Chloroflexota bacterium]
MWKRLLDFVERWDIAWTIIAFNFAGFVTGIVFWYGDHLFNRAADKWYLWPFIPDCPLFAGLFVIAFLGLRRGRDWRLFYTITAYGLIKYGVWTVVYSLAYWRGGGAVTPMNLAMCVSHLGMIAEGVYVSYRIAAPMTTAAVQETPPPMERRGAGERRSRGAGEQWSQRESTLAPLHPCASAQKAPPHPGTSAQKAGFRQRDVLIAFGWFLLSDFVDYGLGQYPLFDTTMVSLPLIQWHTIFMTFALAAVYLALSRRRSAQAGKERIR